jgi:hypothetical protein
MSCPRFGKNCHFGDRCKHQAERPEIERPWRNLHSRFDESLSDEVTISQHESVPDEISTNRIPCSSFCKIYRRVILHTGPGDFMPSDKTHILTHSHTAIDSSESGVTLCQAVGSMSIKC